LKPERGEELCARESSNCRRGKKLEILQEKRIRKKLECQIIR
jgi:hypothetical protein